MSMTIRRATEEDIPAIVSLVNLAYRVEDFFIKGNRTDEVQVRECLAESGFLMAEDAEDDELVACVHVRIQGERGYFGMLSVHPTRQGQGIGPEMIAEAEAWARDAGCTAMDLTYVNLREELPGLYGRLGYVQTGTAPFAAPEKLRMPAEFVTMSKPLVPPAAGGQEQTA
ncbi:MAG: GNAT family N-acetyltransferase [Dehalococcoidia bacterium]|nr:GNAT family N-acetyltransferase [Dehalococcoidia bacterium]